MRIVPKGTTAKQVYCDTPDQMIAFGVSYLKALHPEGWYNLFTPEKLGEYIVNWGVTRTGSFSIQGPCKLALDTAIAEHFEVAMA